MRHVALLGTAAAVMAFAFGAGCGPKGPAVGADPPLPSPSTVQTGVSRSEVTLAAVGPPCKVWIYLPSPKPAGKLPCILIAPAGSRMFHGMGLADGDVPEHLPWVQAGFAVVAYELDGPLSDSPSDRQITEAARAFGKADAGLADAKAALAYALKHVEGIDKKRVYAVGHSSAATTALLVAEHVPGIAGCVAFAPACDVPATLGSAMSTFEQAMPGFSEFIRKASPNAAPEKLKCPLFLFHANDDDNVAGEQMMQFARQVSATNRSVTVDTVPSGGHYDSMLDPGIPHAVRWVKGLR